MADDLLQVTMTREAAERFAEALSYAEARIGPDLEDEGDTVAMKTAHSHADWLRWGIGRIAVAKTNAETASKEHSSYAS